MAVARSRELAAVALHAYGEMRAAIEGFRQLPNEGESGPAFLRRIARQECDKHGLRLDLDLAEVEFSRETAWQLGRVVQEAIANAHHHAKANTITLKIAATGDGVELQLGDNGAAVARSVATDAAKPANGDRFGHYGIEIMAERIAALNGELKFQPEAQGARLCVHLPHTQL